MMRGFCHQHLPARLYRRCRGLLYHTCRGLDGRGRHLSRLHINNRRQAAGDDRFIVDGIPVRSRSSTRTHLAGHPRPPRRRGRAPRSAASAPTSCMCTTSPARQHPLRRLSRRTCAAVNTLHDYWLLCPNNMLYRRDGSTCDPAAHPDGCRQCFRRYDYWASCPTVAVCSPGSPPTYASSSRPAKP